jgi:tRNA G18 (ribose-2'-O)-methylase SpoU
LEIPWLLDVQFVFHTSEAMAKFVHQRHKPATQLPAGCELLIACPPLRSSVNLSRIVRVASCCGVRRIITSGPSRVDPQIARDGAERVTLEVRRSLPPVLKRLRAEGFQLVGLEQTTNSVCLYDFHFNARTVLVVGHERKGLDQATLDMLDDVVEIPVFGLPHSYNVAAATTIALYEYCRQMVRRRSAECSAPGEAD